MDYNFYNDTESEAKNRYRQRQNLARQRDRRIKLLFRRTIIVSIGVIILALIIFLLVVISKAVSPDDSNATEAASIVQETEAPAPAKNTALDFNTPNIPDDNKSVGYYSSQNGGVYIYNQAAYELFGASDESAQDYADCISDFKKLAGDGITVYNMVIPNHTEFGLPKRLIDNNDVPTRSQADNIKKIYSDYSADITPINCYNKLCEHNDEYIYFNTDHHWTGLGAYYAYQAFCEQTDQTPLELSTCTEHTIPDFTGSLFDLDASLANNMDTVHFWTFPYDTYAMMTSQSGAEPQQTTVYYENEGSGSCAYGVFIWGDNQLFVEHNPNLNSNKKIAVVKESYGNAFVPYLTANYDEVHVIDFRYFDRNLLTYCQENGITEVMFLNNVMSANTAIQVDRIRALFE